MARVILGISELLLFGVVAAACVGLAVYLIGSAPWAESVEVIVVDTVDGLLAGLAGVFFVFAALMGLQRTVSRD